MKLSKLTYVVLCLWTSLFSSCENSSDRKDFLIGFSQCCSDPWRQVMEDEMARELNFHARVALEKRVALYDNNNQIAQIRELLGLGIDLLIVAPNESAPLQEIVDSIYGLGIPVILIDRKTDSDQYSAYIGGDNFAIGKTAGEYISNKIEEQGDVIELMLPLEISPAEERHRGFEKAISSYSNVKRIAAIEVNEFPKNLDEQLPELLRNHPQTKAIFGHTDLITEKAFEVAYRMGVAEGMLFVGVDGIPGTGKGIQAVEDGVLDASMLYPTGGTEAIQLAIKILNHLPFDKENLLQTTVIDPSNARTLHLQMKKMASLQENMDQTINLIDELNNSQRSQQVFIVILISSLVLVIVLGGFLWQSLRFKQQANTRLESKNEEIIQQQQRLIEMSKEVKQASQAKVDFFTNISHEIKTPLTLILGFAEDLAPSKKLGKDGQQSLQLIQQNANRLLRLVNQLMDFQKVESDKMQVSASENEVLTVVRNIMKSYEWIARKRQIDFRLMSHQQQLKLWFDVSMLDKIVFNLLSNAFKYTPDQGRIHLILNVDRFENCAKISVEDSGVGLSEEDKEHIFEPFYRGQSGRGDGTGLGLPLSRVLARLHGGDITLTSIKEKGSRFTFSLPMGKDHFKANQLVSTPSLSLPIADGEQTLKASEQYELSEASKGKENKVLIIEDNLEILFFLRKKLEGLYEIEEATDGETAILAAFETIPDLILCDIMLPLKDGVEITKILKSDLRTSHIPLILLTALGSVEKQIEGIEAGADAYIPKPFNVQFLLAKIKNLLHSRQILKEIYGNDLLSLHAELGLNKVDQSFIQQFADYVNRNFHRQDFQVTDLCEELNLSRSQLYRKVKALLGQNISDFIQNTRLKKAEELLVQEQLSITEVAYAVGYSSPHYFSTAFKSKYNITPSGYRRSLS